MGHGVYLGHGVFDRLKNITWHSDFWLSSMPLGLTFWCLMFPPVPVAARPVAVVSLQVQCHPVVVWELLQPCEHLWAFCLQQHGYSGISVKTWTAHCPYLCHKSCRVLELSPSEDSLPCFSQACCRHYGMCTTSYTRMAFPVSVPQACSEADAPDCGICWRAVSTTGTSPLNVQGCFQITLMLSESQKPYWANNHIILHPFLCASGAVMGFFFVWCC